MAKAAAKKTTKPTPAKAAKPEKVKPAAKTAKAPAELKPTRGDVALEKIDPSIARSVRHRGDDPENVRRLAEHVDRLKEAYDSKADIPPVKVYTWPKATVALLGDGANRLDAAAAVGRKKITADIFSCADETDARRRALTCAAGANTDHGLPRSHADKRAAVRAVLLAEEYAESSDSAIGRVASAGHILVRLVREQLSSDGTIPVSSEAHASKKGYDPNAKLRMNLVSDGKGGLKEPDAPAEPAANPVEPVARPAEPTTEAPTPTPAARPRATLDVSWSLVPVGRLDIPTDLLNALEAARVLTVGTLVDRLNSGESYGLTDDEFAGLCEMLSGLQPIDHDVKPGPSAKPTAGEPVTRPVKDETVRDARGRAVPKLIEGVFADGPSWFGARVRALQAVLTDLEAAKGRDYAAALPAVMQVVINHIRDAKESVKQAAPYAVCPHLDSEGVHMQGGKCRVCHGRNWLTNAVYEQLTPELKQCCEPEAAS